MLSSPEFLKLLLQLRVKILTSLGDGDTDMKLPF